jgi:hypothetical protein
VHKVACKAIAATECASLGDRHSALLDPADDSSRQAMGFAKGEKLHTAIFSSQGIPSSRSQQSGKDRVKHIEGEFIVKIQGGLDGNTTFMVYNEQRSFTLDAPQVGEGLKIKKYLQQFPTPYPNLSSYHASVKCFLFARTEVGGVRLFLDKIAPWQTW